jgi:hypothetical protein
MVAVLIRQKVTLVVEPLVSATVVLVLQQSPPSLIPTMEYPMSIPAMTGPIRLKKMSVSLWTMTLSMNFTVINGVSISKKWKILQDK